MRQIKFQIYWIAGHEMLYDTNNDLEFRDKENYWITDLSDAINQPERYKVRQYTGLKDKNGVEIYEGDILSYFGFEYEVTFEESAFGWSEDGQFYAFAEMAIDEIEKTKIIGNIYENPELAK